MTPRIDYHHPGMPDVASHPAANRCPACGYARTGLGSRVCPECGVECTPELVQRASRRERRRRWLIALAVMAFVLYAPFSWLLWMDYPWSDYRWFWIRLWPILPGLPTTILLRALGSRLPESLELACMGVVTLCGLLLLTWLGARGRRWLIITALIAFGLSCYNAWVGLVLFRL